MIHELLFCLVFLRFSFCYIIIAFILRFKGFFLIRRKLHFYFHIPLIAEDRFDSITVHEPVLAGQIFLKGFKEIQIDANAAVTLSETVTPQMIDSNSIFDTVTAI